MYIGQPGAMAPTEPTEAPLLAGIVDTVRMRSMLLRLH